MKKSARLFRPEPESWGLRGDPHLWRELAVRLDDLSPRSTSSEVGARLRTAFRDAIGVDLWDPGAPEAVFIERFEADLPRRRGQLTTVPLHPHTSHTR